MVATAGVDAVAFPGHGFRNVPNFLVFRRQGCGENQFRRSLRPGGLVNKVFIMQSPSKLHKPVPLCRRGAQIGGLRSWQQRWTGRAKRPILIGQTSIRQMDEAATVDDLSTVLRRAPIQAMTVTPGDGFTCP
jgi:hypothetical protein